MSGAPICTICQDSICGKPDDNNNGDNEEDFPVTTRCGHFYHNSCIRRWFGSGAAAIQDYGNRCPYCNKTVSKITGLIRVYPVTEKDEVSILEHGLNEAPPPPVDMDGAGFDQICHLSTRNDALTEDNLCLQEIVVSTEEQNQVLRKQLKGVQDELAEVKRKLENVNLKAAAVAAGGNPSNAVASSSRQPTIDLGCLRIPSPFSIGQMVVLKNDLDLRVGRVKCLLRDIATSNVFVGVEFDVPISGGMSGYLGTLQIFPCNEGHGLILLASALSPLHPTTLSKVMLHSEAQTNSGLIGVSLAASPFPLEKEKQFECILAYGSVGTILGKVKCHLVDLATFDLILGVQFAEPVVGGMSGAIAGIQLFPGRQSNGRLIRIRAAV